MKVPHAQLGSRILVQELDSMRQAQRFAEDPATAVAELTGIIRAALLICDRILVTDTMILDGVYFAAVTPEALAQALGVPVNDLPITVICSAGTLADALRAKQSNVDFIWQLRHRLDEESVHAHWATWTDPGRIGGLRMEDYATMAQLRQPDEHWIRGLSPAASEFFDTVAPVVSRSAIVKVHSPAAHAAHEGDTDIDRVDAWWHAAYLSAVAESVGAAWLGFDASSAEGVSRGRQTGRGWEHFHVDDEVRALTTLMTPAMFGVVRYLSGQARAAMNARPSGIRMRNLMFAITRPVETTGRMRTITNAVLRILLAGAAIASGLPFFKVGELAWVAVGVVVLSTVPWDAVATILVAPLKHKAVLLMSTEGSA